MSNQTIYGYSRSEWGKGGVAFAIGLVVILVWVIVRDSPEESTRKALAKEDRLAAAQAPAEAFDTCKKAIKRFSRDPDKAEVPDIGNMRGGADWRFLWNEHSRPVRLRNGLGLDVATTALCVVDEKTHQIKLLTVDGQQTISPLPTAQKGAQHDR